MSSHISIPSQHHLYCTTWTVYSYLYSITTSLVFYNPTCLVTSLSHHNITYIVQPGLSSHISIPSQHHWYCAARHVQSHIYPITTSLACLVTSLSHHNITYIVQPGLSSQTCIPSHHTFCTTCHVYSHLYPITTSLVLYKLSCVDTPFPSHITGIVQPGLSRHTFSLSHHWYCTTCRV